jgi:hypothetical protein
MDKVALLQAPTARALTPLREELLSGAPAGYPFYQAVLSPDNRIYEVPILATGKMVVFTAQLHQSQAQEPPLSQLATEPFSFFLAIWQIRAPARVSLVDLCH